MTFDPSKLAGLRNDLRSTIQSRFESMTVAVDASSSPPPELYHYTTLGGFEGIVSDGAIRLTDARYLNDMGELSYADKVIRDAADSVLNETNGTELTEILRGIDLSDMTALEGLIPFVACFCTESNLLSQWRGYGTDSSPVAMGFDFKWSAPSGQFINLHSDGPDQGGDVLQKVVYDREAQYESARLIISDWVSMAHSIEAEFGPDCMTSIAFYGLFELRLRLSALRLSFKDSAFEEEHEWRIIRLLSPYDEIEGRTEDALLPGDFAEHAGISLPTGPSSTRRNNAMGFEIKFRTSNLGMVPFTEIRFSPRNPYGELPLRSVTQGPTAYPELAAEGINLYLLSKGYKDYEVRLSGIPLR